MTPIDNVDPIRSELEAMRPAIEGFADEVRNEDPNIDEDNHVAYLIDGFMFGENGLHYNEDLYIIVSHNSWLIANEYASEEEYGFNPLFTPEDYDDSLITGIDHYCSTSEFEDHVTVQDLGDVFRHLYKTT